MKCIYSLLDTYSWTIKDNVCVFTKNKDSNHSDIESAIQQEIREQFNNRHIKYAIQFEGITFEPVTFDHYRFSKDLIFKECTFIKCPDEVTDSTNEGATLHTTHSFKNMTVDRDLVFEGVTVKGSCDFYRITCTGHLHLGKNTQPSTFETIRMRQGRLSKLLFPRESTVTGLLSIKNSSIEQECEFRGFVGTLECERAHIGHACTLSGARIKRFNARDMWVEGRFQAINTYFLKEADCSLATFSGLANFSNSIFYRGVRFSDASFKRNTFFNKTFLGPFSTFTRVSFDEILYFDPLKHSCIIWEDILLNGPLRTPSQANLTLFNTYWKERFLVWSLQIPLEKRFVVPKEKVDLIKKEKFFATNLENSNDQPDSSDGPKSHPDKITYKSYLEYETKYWKMLLPQNKSHRVRSSVSYYLEEIEKKMDDIENSRLKEKEQICGVLKQGYLNALCEREEDFAFYESREAERKSAESVTAKVWLFFMKLTGYGTSPQKTFLSMMVAFILLLIVRWWIHGKDVLNSLYASIRLLIGAESAEVYQNGATIDLLIAGFGFISLTYFVLTLSHKTNRS